MNKRQLKNGTKLYLNKGDETTWYNAFEGVLSELQAMLKDEDLKGCTTKEDQQIIASIGYEITFKRVVKP